MKFKNAMLSEFRVSRTVGLQLSFSTNRSIVLRCQSILRLSGWGIVSSCAFREHSHLHSSAPTHSHEVVWSGLFTDLLRKNIPFPVDLFSNIDYSCDEPGCLGLEKVCPLRSISETRRRVQGR